MGYLRKWGTRWHSWLRHCATRRKVAGSIPDDVIGIFHWPNPPGRTMALGLTHPLTEMSTRNISWGVGGAKAAGAVGWQPYHLHVPIVLKSQNLNFLEPSGPVQAFTYGSGWIPPYPYRLHTLQVQTFESTFRNVRDFDDDEFWSSSKSCWLFPSATWGLTMPRDANVQGRVLLNRHNKGMGYGFVTAFMWLGAESVNGLYERGNGLRPRNGGELLEWRSVNQHSTPLDNAVAGVIVLLLLYVWLFLLYQCKATPIQALRTPGCWGSQISKQSVQKGYR